MPRVGRPIFLSIILGAAACAEAERGVAGTTGSGDAADGGSGESSDRGPDAHESGAGASDAGTQDERVGSEGSVEAAPTETGAEGGIVVDATATDGAASITVCPPGPFPTPIVGNSTSECAGFAFRYSYNEGPTWIAGQNAFFFSNFVQGQAMPGDIIKYTPGSGCEIFITDVGCNGLAVAPDGNLLAACQRSRSVIEFDVITKQPTTLAAAYMNRMLDTPNDLVAHTNGSTYFTNPTYELQGRPQGVGPAVFFRDPAGKLTAIATGGAPNGIALSPDERRLYVVGAGQWDIDPGGVPTNKQSTFVSGDGIAVDCAGNVYSSTGTIKSAQGDDVGTFQGGTNLAFGGADGKTLLIVGGGTSVRSVAMNLPGLP